MAQIMYRILNKMHTHNNITYLTTNVGQCPTWWPPYWI